MRICTVAGAYDTEDEDDFDDDEEEIDPDSLSYEVSYMLRCSYTSFNLLGRLMIWPDRLCSAHKLPIHPHPQAIMYIPSCNGKALLCWERDGLQRFSPPLLAPAWPQPRSEGASDEV